VSRFSFTGHPSSVGETYFEHLRRAAGFGASMIGGGLACLVHAVLPFLFTHTAATVIAALNTRMVAGRTGPWRTGPSATRAA
jgi:hypothetical protein